MDWPIFKSRVSGLDVFGLGWDPPKGGGTPPFWGPIWDPILGHFLVTFVCPTKQSILGPLLETFGTPFLSLGCVTFVHIFTLVTFVTFVCVFTFVTFVTFVKTQFRVLYKPVTNFKSVFN